MTPRLSGLARTLLVIIAACATSAYSQSPGQVTAQPGNLTGILYAGSFGQWQVPAGNVGPYSWNNPAFCKTDADGFYLNPIFQAGTPITIVDTGNPAHTEIVTPTAFSIGTWGCSITVAPVYQHNTYYLTSGTGGLQEAINFAKSLPYVVILTPDWSRLGGITSMITAAQGSTPVSILDQRTSCFVSYAWGSSTYGINGACSGGITPGTVTSVACANLSPLFNCTVNTPTTTPSIVFTQQTTGDLKFFGNTSGSTAMPNFIQFIQGSGISLTEGTNSLTISASAVPVEFQTNGADNASQSLLDLDAGSNITLTNTSGGHVRIDASGSGVGGCEGPLPGDATSTNCGNDNLTGNTSTDVETFGYSNANILPSYQKIMIGAGNGNANSGLTGLPNPVVAVGYNNYVFNSATVDAALVYAFGINNFSGGGTLPSSAVYVEVTAIGDTNVCGAQYGDTRITDSYFLGEQNDCYTGAGTMRQSNVLAMGDTNFNIAFSFGTPTDTYNDIIAFGDTSVQLGSTSGNDTTHDVIGIGDEAVAGSNFTDIVAMGFGPVNGTGGTDIVGIGDQPSSNVNGAHDIVALGDEAIVGQPFTNPITGADLVGIGNHPLACNTSGSDNVAIGDYAGSVGWTNSSSCGNSNKTGSNNVWVGNNAGPNTTTQLSNTIGIGYQAYNTASNQTVIGNSSITQVYLFGTGNGCLSASGGLITGSGVACGSGGGGAAFSAITGSTNTTASMVVGTGASMSTAGSGTIAATSVGGITVSGTPSIGQVLTATSTSAADWQTPAGSMTWPAGAAGIPNYSGSSSWGTTYNASNLIPSNFLPLATTSVFGVFKPDGSTITCTAGVCSAPTGGAGTVTSVGLSLPAMFTVTGSPVTSSGTLGATLASQSAHAAFIGPTSGSAAPTFRALVASDLPTIALSGLATQAANTIVGNATASSAAPTALSIPSCSGASNALTWTSATGFGCNTISGGGSGTVGSGVANQVAYYAATGTAIVGDSRLIDNGSSLAYTGSGAGYSSYQIGTNTFASLPTCNSGQEGTDAPVIDSTTNTWGATVTGGGSNHVKAYCDGTNWTVEAK